MKKINSELNKEFDYLKNMNIYTSNPEITDIQIKAALASNHLKRWINNQFKNFSKLFYLDSEKKPFCIIHNVIMFGNKAGFILAESNLYNKGKTVKVPGVAFLRGDGVAILPILRTPDQHEYGILVNQARTPVGASSFYEIPAGMMDGDNNFHSKAIDELKEEVGEDIAPTPEEIIHVLDYYASPGGTDELINVSYYIKNVDFDLINKLNNRKTGKQEENEDITVCVIPIEDIKKYIEKDAKSLLAYNGYIDDCELSEEFNLKM